MATVVSRVEPDGPRERPLTIGAVCRRLQDEFPDISISKIRYLEDQGLLAPRRTQGGYRLFSEDDLERLEEASLALLVRDAEGVVAPRAAAPADAEIEAPLAQVIERRDLAGDAQGMVQGQELHGRAHAHVFGPGGDPARDQKGGR